jgi:DNA-binding HxlR family transcriptional regulator
MSTQRSYDDPCGIARALDRIGERWALLVVRELLLGPKRFTDLRAGLPTASPNVLSQRLRELEACGVLQRRVLPPPAGATVYELTDWGRALEPVLLSLARWGSRRTITSERDLSVDALLIALQTTFDPALCAGSKGRIELRFGTDRVQVSVDRRGLVIERGAGQAFDAAISTDSAGLRRLVFGRETLAQAKRARSVSVEGDEAFAQRFLGMFARPQIIDTVA